MELRWLSCLVGDHRWIVGPPEQAYRHCRDCRRFETVEQANPSRGILPAAWTAQGTWTRSPDA